jgi:hypothetical protein
MMMMMMMVLPLLLLRMWKLDFITTNLTWWESVLVKVMHTNG